MGTQPRLAEINLKNHNISGWRCKAGQAKITETIAIYPGHAGFWASIKKDTQSTKTRCYSFALAESKSV